MAGFRIRTAREEDIEQLIETAMCAYPGRGGFDRYKRSLTQNPFGGLNDVRVIEKDGRIAGQAALYALEIWLGGRRVQAGGIASVAISPEARRQGIARALIDELHTEVDARNAALTLLYPFREGFYASFGYSTVAPLLCLRVASKAIARAWSRGSLDGFALAPLQGALLAQARELYQEVAAAEAGRLVRSETRWLALFSRESQHWMGAVSPSGLLQGYVCFSYDAPVLHNRQMLIVHELVARDARAKRALFVALGNQQDQVDDVEITLPFDDPLPFAFLDAPGSRQGTAAIEHPLGVLGAGPMVRLADPRRALAARGYTEDGDLTFVVDDRGKETVRLIVRGGVAEAREGKGSPEIELSRSTLGSIVSAGIRPSAAAELGLLRADPATVRTADHIFAGPRFQCLDPF